MSEYKKMCEYSHEEFIDIISNMNEEELLSFSANYGGYPVLFRQALDPRVCHIPFIQTGAAIIIRNANKEILLQARTDRDQWGLPGGCQDLGESLKNTAIREAYEETGIILKEEDLILIDTISGPSRKNSYPNGDIVYNNSSLYLADVGNIDISSLKCDSETKKLQFFDLQHLPNNLMDKDQIDIYCRYSEKGD